MRHPRLLIGLLVLATVLVDLVVWSMGLEDSWPASASFEYDVLVIWPLALSQASLMAIWVGYGGKLVPWTALLLIITILGWGHLYSVIINRESAGITGVLMLQSAMIIATFGSTRLAGVRLVRWKGIPATSAAGRRPVQFSLAFMLSLLTVVAVALGLVSYTIGFERLGAMFSECLKEAGPLGAVSFGSTLIAMTALWTSLGTRRPLLRLITLFVIPCGIVAAWSNMGVGSAWASATVALGQVFWLCISLAVVRVAGFRLVRERASVRASASSTAAVAATEAEELFERRLPVETEER